jgi:hypothetical protein
MQKALRRARIGYQGLELSLGNDLIGLNPVPHRECAIGKPCRVVFLLEAGRDLLVGLAVDEQKSFVCHVVPLGISAGRLPASCLDYSMKELHNAN